MDSEYRCYFFGNYYLSSIQQGIQAQHVQRRMAVKYLAEEDNTLTPLMYEEYARQHETVVLKNGGDANSMKNILELMKNKRNDLPWAYFSEPGIDNALTSIGIVIPSRLFDNAMDLYTQVSEGALLDIQNPNSPGWKITTVQYTRGVGPVVAQYTDFEWKLVELLKNTRLAR